MTKGTVFNPDSAATFPSHRPSDSMSAIVPSSVRRQNKLCPQLPILRRGDGLYPVGPAQDHIGRPTATPTRRATPLFQRHLSFHPG